jgi:hypothetical protein
MKDKKKLPDGWGRSVINGKEIITPPGSILNQEDNNPVIENGKDENGDYYEIRAKDKNPLKLEMEPLDLEASNKSKKLGRALASKRKK